MMNICARFIKIVSREIAVNGRTDRPEKIMLAAYGIIKIKRVRSVRKYCRKGF